MSTGIESMAAIAGELLPLLEECGFEDALAVAQLLQVRLRQPRAYVTVAGETSTGKSSLINGLFGRDLLSAAASPTTGTVTHVACMECSPDRQFAIYRDGTQEELGREEFKTLSLSPTPELLRLQVRALPKEGRFNGLQLFDTPGYNATLAAHEEVLREFLPQSDAVVFVTGFRSGFGQVDQDLLEVIQSAIHGLDEVPVLMVVNRTPPGTPVDHPRVRKSYDNARDCLKRDVQLLLVESATSDPATHAGGYAIPESLPLWDAIAARLADPTHVRTVHARLGLLLAELLDETAARLQRRLIELTASREDVDVMRAQIGDLVRAREQSLEAVDRMGGRLATQIPRTIERAAPTLKEEMTGEIADSSKWLGAADCAEWLTGHALPFAVRRVARSIEEQIALELEELNRELEEIANTAIKRITQRVQVKSDVSRRFAENLVSTLLKKAAGAGAGNILRGLGGVGGTAAGAGNLVKMAVSRLGKLFGQTFSRELYTQIGKTFTKEAIERLNVFTTIIMEGVKYLYHVSTWQEKLIQRVNEGIEGWAKELTGDLRGKTIPGIIEANKSSVNQCYDDMIGSDLDKVEVDAAEKASLVGELERRITLVEKLRKQLESAA